MLKERTSALKEQEEKLGALVAQLQLDKAKEVGFLYKVGMVILLKLLTPLTIFGAKKNHHICVVCCP